MTILIGAVFLMSQFPARAAGNALSSYEGIRLAATPASCNAVTNVLAASSVSGVAPFTVPTNIPDTITPIAFPLFPTVQRACISAAPIILVIPMISPVLPTTSTSILRSPYLVNREAIAACCTDVKLRSAMRFFRFSSSCSAERTSFLKESASFLAVRATFNASDAAACALLASLSAFANSRCAAWAFTSASLASARAASAMPLTESASAWAILAESAASPASRVAALTFASLHSWILALRSSIFALVFNSPSNPTTIKSHPTNAAILANSTRCSKITILYLYRRIRLRAMDRMSYLNSGNSNIRPTITATLDQNWRENHRCLAPAKSCLEHSLSVKIRSGGNIQSYAAKRAG